MIDTILNTSGEDTKSPPKHLVFEVWRGDFHSLPYIYIGGMNTLYYIYRYINETPVICGVK